MYVVYTEILNGTPNPERWYYGTFESSNRANEVALRLGSEYPTYHCVADLEDAEELGIRNMPQ